MADVKTENDQCECPVCQEDYKDPKLLRCGHTICRQCVLSWLETGGPQKGCPLCRASILPPQSAGSNTAVDVAGLVDVLPTDVASLAVVDCKHLLQGDHFCNVCDDDNPASSICIDCNLKVCAACSKTHRKFPAFREHSVEQINTLTPERLAALRKSFCDVHKDRQAELYCPTDRSLICFLCSSSKHRTCPGVDVLADCATKEREGLKGLSERLRKKRTYLEAQISYLDEKATTVRTESSVIKGQVKAMVDDLRAALERRYHEFILAIQGEEDGIVAMISNKKSCLRDEHASIVAHVYVADRLVTTAADGSLLTSLPNLKASMEALENQKQGRSPVDFEDIPVFAAHCEMMTCLEKAGSVLREVVTMATPLSVARSTKTNVTSEKQKDMSDLPWSLISEEANDAKLKDDVADLKEELELSFGNPYDVKKQQINTPISTALAETASGIVRDLLLTGAEVLTGIRESSEAAPAYHSSICRENTICHRTGILSYEGSPSEMPISQFVGKKPLDPKCSKFSIEIVNEGKTGIIGLGLCRPLYPPQKMAGWVRGSVGYHSDDGGIFFGFSQAKLHKSKCKEHDIMSVEVDFSTQSLSFCKNNSLEFKTGFLQIPDCGFYPIVNLKSPGGAVRLLEREPWKSD